MVVTLIFPLFTNVELHNIFKQNLTSYFLFSNLSEMEGGISLQACVINVSSFPLS